MPRKASADSDLVEKAVACMKKHPTLSASEAMKLAGFSDSDIKNRSIHRLLYRRLEGNSKRGNPVLEVFLQTPQPASTDVSPLTNHDTASSATTSTTNGASLPRQPKIRRLNSRQKQDQRVEELSKKLLFKEAHKAATKLYDEERKKEGGMSVRQVSQKIKSEFGVGPSKASVHRYVSNGNVGESPKKMGPVGSISPIVYKTLCTAFASKLRIVQLNAKGSYTIKQQTQLLMTAMNLGYAEATPLWKRIVRDTALDMVAGKVQVAEERRVQWTTFHNLDLWFASWESTLDEYSFFEVDGSGQKIIPDHILQNILNFDKTSLSLDGSIITRGGRPPIAFEDPWLPQVGKPTSKTLQTTMMINSSNAWGEALPPHF